MDWNMVFNGNNAGNETAWFLVSCAYQYFRQCLISAKSPHVSWSIRFHSILKAIGYRVWPAPDYPDRFHEVREMIEAWNENMQNNFKPGHFVCLDESMSTWTNMHTCPGFMFVPQKPWPFGNEYHTVKYNEKTKWLITQDEYFRSVCHWSIDQCYNLNYS